MANTGSVSESADELPWHEIAEFGLNAVLGSSLLGVVVVSRDGRITFVNDQFRAQFGVVGSDSTGSNLIEIVGEETYGRLIPEGSVPLWAPTDLKIDRGSRDRPGPLLRARAWSMRRDAKVIGHVVVCIDISDRYDDIRQVRVADDLISAFMSAVRDAVLVIDSDGLITAASGSVEDMFGWRVGDLLGADLSILMKPSSGVSHAELVGRFTRGSESSVVGKWRKLEGVRRDGTVIPIEIRVVENVIGDPPGFVGFIRDLREIEDLNRQLDRAFRTDDLTGLLTQHSFVAALRSWVSSDTGPFSLVKVDLARFHHVNSAYGYRTGDELLKAVARELRSVVPEMPLGRVGGDRFAFVVEPDEVDRAVRALRSRVEGRGRSRGISHPIRLHVGVARFTSGSAEDLLRAADGALRRAKSTSSGSYVEFNEDIGRDLDDEIALLADIHGAIQSRQLVTYFQPEIDLKTGEVVGHEALVRWQHPHRGLIPPDRFLPMAGSENLMPALGVQVLSSSLDFIRKSSDLGYTGRVWVNLSSAQLLDDSVVNYTRSAIQGGLDPARLGFELTEQDAFAVETMAADHLQNMVDLGIAIAIDDFGTGFSSLTQLRSIPANYVKLDRSFLMAIHTDEMQERFVGSCIDLAHTLGREVVAEGIESEADAELVARLGCDLAQGYFFGRPVPPDEALEALKPS